MPEGQKRNIKPVGVHKKSGKIVYTYQMHDSEDMFLGFIPEEEIEKDRKDATTATP